jgi:Outer membrane protein Omp28
MALPFDELIRQEFGVNSFPTGRLNRTSRWLPPYEVGDVTTMAGTSSPIGIGIESTVNGNSLTATISVSSEEALSDKKLVVYVTEDGIISDQVNYLNNDETSIYYQQGDPIVDFVHDDVLRASLTNIFGNAIPATPALEEYKVTLNTDLNPAFDFANLHLVVMVTENDNTTINSQEAKVNETVPYQ